METAGFDGQQNGERILASLQGHVFVRNISLIGIAVLGLFFLGMVFLVASATPAAAGLVRSIGISLCMTFLAIGTWFVAASHEGNRTYITDRRIIRFETVAPFFRTKRALFWSEALKAKAYAPNFIFRLLGIGNLHVEPQIGESESVRVYNIAYYEDLANYIDKILYTVKSSPGDIKYIREFVSKPKGARG